ncbi:MAG: sigma-70 RNA polymerase sigma factor region 4 domain-containing protein [Acidithiobacillus sp.]
MISCIQKIPLDYSNARITVCPESPSPKTPELTSDFFEKQQNSGENPEFRPDPKSASEFDKIDTKSDWNHLATVIQTRLKIRGTAADTDYISDYLSRYVHEIQDDFDAEDEVERKAEIAEFDLHLGKLKPKLAAIMVLRIRERWTFTPISKLLNVSDQQADNLFQEAEKYFNSELIQVDFFAHGITLDSPVDELCAALIAAARATKSPAGRKPKSKKKSKQERDDLFQEVL